MRIVQSVGKLEPQFREILGKAIDRTQFIDVVTDTADTEVEIVHGLGIIPVGFIVIGRDKPGSTYDSGTAFTTEKLFIKDSGATVALRLLIF